MATRTQTGDGARWKVLATSIAAQVRDDNLTLVAAGVAFYAFLSLFPALVALVSIYGLVADPADVASQVDRLSNAIPNDARTLINDQLQQVVSSNRAGLSIGVVVGIAIALWGASSAVQQLLLALGGIDGQRDDRGFVSARLRAIGVTVAAIVFISLAVILLTVAPSLGDEVAGSSGRLVVSLLRWPLLVGAFAVGLGLLYRQTTGEGHSRARLLSWGVVVATVAWSVASVLFSLYVTMFGSYNKTYGSIAAVVILMLWLFLTALCVLLGAEVNAVQHREDANGLFGESHPA